MISTLGKADLRPWAWALRRVVRSIMRLCRPALVKFRRMDVGAALVRLSSQGDTSYVVADASARRGKRNDCRREAYDDK
jgi:hypothetical protein